MKQVLQHFRTGHVELADVPCPLIRPGHLLIHTSASLISPGTERMLVEFGQASLVGKARAQPERVRQVFDKIRTDGLMPALEAVRSRLDEPFPLGYSNVGRVLAVGAGVAGFAVGDRVVSNGHHAEVVCVPATLAALVPETVDDDAATFAVQGAIALNGVRLLDATLGESVVVIGLGLLGQLAVQILRAHGCRVLGIDLNPDRCDLARSFGCQALCTNDGADPVRAARAFTRERGADGVVITASAKGHAIMHEAAQMCRQRGRIVLVGVVGLHLLRDDFYENELTFRVACSYGPGRYDPAYEREGRDYPLPYVRWTAARNFEAVLDLLAQGAINVRPLISQRLPHAEAARAYEGLLADRATLGVVLTYPPAPAATATLRELRPPVMPALSAAVRPTVGVIGTGHFARQVLLPAISAAGGHLRCLASAGGVTSLHAARSFAAQQATTDYREILRSPEISVVFIATRHDTHARLVAEALAAGKHVFVEKPLALDVEGLDLVRQAQAAHPELQLVVGFNRRFAPHALKARELLAGRTQPLALSMLVNAGELAADHWARDPGVGGGRIIGEACHFIDLALFLCGEPITSAQAVRLGARSAASDETTSINLTFADGSIATVLYWTNGPKSYPKERVEIFSEGRVLVIDNWRALRAHNWRGAPRMRMRQNKGHRDEVAAFLARVAAGGAPLIPFAELEMVTAATLAVVQSAAIGDTVPLPPPAPTAFASASQLERNYVSESDSLRAQ